MSRSVNFIVHYNVEMIGDVQQQRKVNIPLHNISDEQAERAADMDKDFLLSNNYFQGELLTAFKGNGHSVVPVSWEEGTFTTTKDEEIFKEKITIQNITLEEGYEERMKRESEWIKNLTSKMRENRSSTNKEKGDQPWINL